MCSVRLGEVGQRVWAWIFGDVRIWARSPTCPWKGRLPRHQSESCPLPIMSASCIRMTPPVPFAPKSFCAANVPQWSALCQRCMKAQSESQHSNLARSNMHVGMARYGRLNDVNHEPWLRSSWRRGFLHAAAACRWMEEPSGSQRLRDAMARHMAACDGVLACASGSVHHLQQSHAAICTQPIPVRPCTHVMKRASVSCMPVCALQEVQLYDVEQHWQPVLQAGAEIGGLAMAGPQLLLAAAGREVLLWRGPRLMRRFQGACAVAAARKALPWLPWCCQHSSLPAACGFYSLSLQLAQVTAPFCRTVTATPCKLCRCRCAHRCAAAEHSRRHRSERNTARKRRPGAHHHAPWRRLCNTL